MRAESPLPILKTTLIDSLVERPSLLSLHHCGNHHPSPGPPLQHPILNGPASTLPSLFLHPPVPITWAIIMLDRPDYVTRFPAHYGLRGSMWSGPILTSCRISCSSSHSSGSCAGPPSGLEHPNLFCIRDVGLPDASPWNLLAPDSGLSLLVDIRVSAQTSPPWPC